MGGPTVSREVLLDRVRSACGRAAGADLGAPPAGPPTAPPADLPAAPPAGPPALPGPLAFDDPVGLFAERAAQVGVRVEMVASLDDAAGRIAAWCRARGARRAAAWNVPDLEPVLSRLRDAGVAILGPAAPVEAVAVAEVGVTGADWGIAETGTLVLASGPERPRMASLLPPVHLAVMRVARILPDLATLFDRCGPLPSALTFITGPSRSADIGLVPTLGAHGPMEVHVFLLDG